jgi:hypothetical protein
MLWIVEWPSILGLWTWPICNVFDLMLYIEEWLHQATDSYSTVFSLTLASLYLLLLSSPISHHFLWLIHNTLSARSSQLLKNQAILISSKTKQVCITFFLSSLDLCIFSSFFFYDFLWILKIHTIRFQKNCNAIFLWKFISYGSRRTYCNILKIKK